MSSYGTFEAPDAPETHKHTFNMIPFIPALIFLVLGIIVVSIGITECLSKNYTEYCIQQAAPIVGVFVGAIICALFIAITWIEYKH